MGPNALNNPFSLLLRIFCGLHKEIFMFIRIFTGYNIFMQCWKNAMFASKKNAPMPTDSMVSSELSQ